MRLLSFLPLLLLACQTTPAPKPAPPVDRTPVESAPVGAEAVPAPAPPPEAGSSQKRTVLGGLTVDEVGGTIRRHWNEIKDCYEKELTPRPNLAGEVKLYFEIGPTGEVVAERVKESTLDSVQVEQCMLKSVRTWKFPAPRGGGIVNVNYPFIFQPQR